jgi:hypothetical protein
MNGAQTAVISDAKITLARIIGEQATSDLLVGAFSTWLHLKGLAIPSIEEIADTAATKKGASRNYRDVAILGFVTTEQHIAEKHGKEFVALLNWLMGRPLQVGGEPTPLLSDPVAVLGLAVGAKHCLGGQELTAFETWSKKVMSEMEKMVGKSGWPGALHFALQNPHQSVPGALWVQAGLSIRLIEHEPAEQDLSAILRETTEGILEISQASEAALRLAAISKACGSVFDVNISSLTVQNVATVLSRIEPIFSRWVWEEKPRTTRRNGEARKWHVENEYHFQSLLYAVLKPFLPDLREEQYLQSTAQLQPRADLCLLPLKLLIEVKFWYQKNSIKKLIEEVAADVSLYLKSGGPYSSLIVAIWDDGVRTEEHAELKGGLSSLEGVKAVVVVNRPSMMESSAE